MSKGRESAAFSEFGSDLKQARQAMGLSRRALAEQVSIDPRYLANIENSGSLPSLPVFYALVKICRLPVEGYFFAAQETENEQRRRIAQKLRLCPEEYLPIIEAALNGALMINATATSPENSSPNKKNAKM